MKKFTVVEIIAQIFGRCEFGSVDISEIFGSIDLCSADEKYLPLLYMIIGKTKKEVTLVPMLTAPYNLIDAFDKNNYPLDEDEMKRKMVRKIRNGRAVIVIDPFTDFCCKKDKSFLVAFPEAKFTIPLCDIEKVDKKRKKVTIEEYQYLMETPVEENPTGKVLKAIIKEVKHQKEYVNIIKKLDKAMKNK